MKQLSLYNSIKCLFILIFYAKLMQYLIRICFVEAQSENRKWNVFQNWVKMTQVHELSFVDLRDLLSEKTNEMKKLADHIDEIKTCLAQKIGVKLETLKLDDNNNYSVQKVQDREVQVSLSSNDWVWTSKSERFTFTVHNIQYICIHTFSDIFLNHSKMLKHKPKLIRKWQKNVYYLQLFIAKDYRILIILDPRKSNSYGATLNEYHSRKLNKVF